MYSISNFFIINIFYFTPFKIVFPEAMTAAELTNLIYKGMERAELVMFNEICPERDTVVRALSIPSDKLTNDGFKVTAIDWEALPATDRNNYRIILENAKIPLQPNHYTQPKTVI